MRLVNICPAALFIVVTLQPFKPTMTSPDHAPPALPPSTASALRKVYRPLYVWGQLSSWFKQTVNDPTASLSAERRGTASLPDVESAFGGGRARYAPKVRAAAAVPACWLEGSFLA